jgi:hypothetical protein
MIKETKEQLSFCKYLQLLNISFMCDYYSFLPLKSRFGLQSMRVKNMPDIHVFEPRGQYAGLFIEMKRNLENKDIFKKDGCVKSEYAEQYHKILELKQKGYYCSFAFGFDDARRILDEYLLIK